MKNTINHYSTGILLTLNTYNKQSNIPFNISYYKY